MSVFRELSRLVVRGVLAEQADTLLGFLGERFSDNSRRLQRALEQAGARAWDTLEYALAGPSLWQSTFGCLSSRDARALRQQIHAFLDVLPPTRLPGDPAKFRAECLKELRSARRVKLVPGAPLGAHEVIGDPTAFVRFHDLRHAIEHDHRCLVNIAVALRKEGYGLLAQYVEIRPAGGGETLLAQAARFFFRREVESDPKLATGLTLETLEGLGASQKDGFAQTKQELCDLKSRVQSLADPVHALEEKLAAQGEELRRMSELLQKLLDGQNAVQPASRPTPPPTRKRLILEVFDPPTN